jgi:hypothetical protein
MLNNYTWSNNNNNNKSNLSVIIFGYKWWGYKVQTLKFVKHNVRKAKTPKYSTKKKKSKAAQGHKKLQNPRSVFSCTALDGQS